MQLIDLRGVPQNPPTLQNMQSNLIDIDNSSSIAAGLINGVLYWSSTEYSHDPRVAALDQIFKANGANSAQGNIVKSTPLSVRCVRGVTH